MLRRESGYLSTRTLLAGRYEAHCTSLATHGGVASPRNGMTIPRRRALPCAAMNAHYAPFNYGVQVHGQA
jgi:hypothetical protein